MGISPITVAYITYITNNMYTYIHTYSAITSDNFFSSLTLNVWMRLKFSSMFENNLNQTIKSSHPGTTPVTFTKLVFSSYEDSRAYITTIISSVNKPRSIITIGRKEPVHVQLWLNFIIEFSMDLLGDQMSQRSQVSRIALFRWLYVSEWMSELLTGVGEVKSYLRLLSGQL